MQSGRIEGATRVCGQSQGYQGLAIRDEVINCPVNGEATPQMVSAWFPSPAELAALNSGAPVHVLILGRVPPPMLVEVGPVTAPIAVDAESAAEMQAQIWAAGVTIEEAGHIAKALRRNGFKLVRAP
jgi:hypothetical protein